ncbi:Na/Pi symporter [Calidifontibacillus erzurumensis]|uniref:Na/Pi cotransporter family protein n=1 Tax=Calidifontibacillus erzurumensis TaxID=2741433 RepID=A0A8J8GAT5_9BACI|nr:Na/Pi symporter [Calidifontibacillus erzurumensis]NSL50282.1 Na/Pi cotransporter family protein [Calidifontibacillus erzurumensis]
MIKIFTLFTVFIAIFLYGMTVMRIGLYNLSHKRIQELLVKITDSPFKGMVVGTFITAILQSSSAVMVITIGFIAAGMLTFKQSIGIILGTNIGTTLTTEFIAFDLFDAILPLLLIGAILLFTKNHISFNIGAILFGLGCLFVAMNGFENLAKPLSSIPVVHTSIKLSNESNLIGVGLGTLLTAIIQSSTATTGIIMGFLNENLVTLTSGIAIVLGANIGTCITAFIASIGANKEAKWAAYAHIWLNIFGVLLFFPFIKSLGDVASFLTSLPDVQLAHVSVIFNVLSSFIALPLAGLLAQFIMKLHGEKA